MTPETRNSAINAALSLVAHVTGLSDSMSGVHGLVVGLQGAAPALEDAWAYFQTDEGQRALKHAQEVISALAKTLPQHDATDSAAAAPQAAPVNAGWRLEWDALEGYKWVREG